jgi:hypothetical protein
MSLQLSDTIVALSSRIDWRQRHGDGRLQLVFLNST